MTWNLSSWLAGAHVGAAIPEALAARGVYTYRLPSAFNTDIDRAVSMKHGVFMKAERILHELVNSLPAVPTAQAQILWVPLYTAALGSTQQPQRENKRRDVRQMCVHLVPIRACATCTCS